VRYLGWSDSRRLHPSPYHPALPHQPDISTERRDPDATREETFFHGSRQALLNHTERMLELEREYARRFPERTKADALRTRKGSRSQAGQPTGR
jgi:Family of unknown function (DUF6158)